MIATEVRPDGAAVRLKFPPVLYAVLLVLALALHWWVLPWGMPRHPAVLVAGILLSVAGIAFALAGVATVLRHHSTLAPHRRVDHLVTAGPFRLSRNPMYTGLAVGLLAGPALWAGTWWPLVLLPACLLTVLLLVIRPEEAYLATRFPAEYAAYRRGVRRWL